VVHAPITASRTSNLLRAITTLFSVQIGQSPYYAFMASVTLRWKEVWEVLWRAIRSTLIRMDPFALRKADPPLAQWMTAVGSG